MTANVSKGVASNNAHLGASEPRCGESAKDETRGWAQHLRAGLIDLKQLAAKGWLEHNAAMPALKQAQTALDIRVPEAFHAGIEHGDSTLSLQVIPSVQEVNIAPEELSDPIGDERFSTHPGLTHRYADRALIKVTYQCAMYCRFCFRRHKVSHPEENLSFAALQPAYEYVEQHPEITEIIFTGGDPLVLTDARIDEHLSRVEEIPSVRTIRFHTRIPTALPERITPELCERLARSSKMIWLVAHVNSASELTPESRRALKRLRCAGVGLASQSVLLKGVNDSHQALVALFGSLYELGVVPYYLHYPDLAQGTSHFRIPLEQAMELVSSLQGHLPGLAVPRLIVDIPGGYGKIPLSNNNWRRGVDGSWWFLSPTQHTWQKTDYPN
jgi:lysine 2,3-aminomutase